MARPSNTDARRGQIIEGLLQAMAVHGYDGASIPLIAQQAGLSPGLVHYHFRSKQEILLGLIDELVRRLLRRYAGRAESASSPRGRLYALLDAQVALGHDADPAAVACWVAIGAEAVRNETVRSAYRAAIEAGSKELRARIHEVLRDEGRQAASVGEIASGLTAAIQGCYQLATVAQSTPRGFAAPMIRRLADGLIAAQPSAKP